MNVGHYLQVFERERFQRVFRNTNWLIVERLVRLAIGLLVGIVVARYLGPEQYGILAYAGAIIALLGPLTYLGLSGLVVRDLVHQPDEQGAIMRATVFLKSLGALFTILAVCVVAVFVHGPGEPEFLVLLILAVGVLVAPFTALDLWFQSRVQSRYSVMANTIALLVSAGLRLGLVFVGASLAAFAGAISLQILLAAAILALFYSRKRPPGLRWKRAPGKARELFSQSWLLALAGLFALMNLQADRVMLAALFPDPAEVGIYSVAATISELWYFLPTAMATSVFPYLVKKRITDPGLFRRRLQQLLDLFFVMAFAIAVVLTFAAGPLMTALYGASYQGAGPILAVHIWAGVFMFMQSVANKYVLVENLLKFQLCNHGAAALLNVVLNIFLIPRYGGIGAAWATLISYAASSYFFLFLYPRTRALAFAISRSYILPIRMLSRRQRSAHAS